MLYDICDFNEKWRNIEFLMISNSLRVKCVINQTNYSLLNRASNQFLSETKLYEKVLH